MYPKIPGRRGRLRVDESYLSESSIIPPSCLCISLLASVNQISCKIPKMKREKGKRRKSDEKQTMAGEILMVTTCKYEEDHKQILLSAFSKAEKNSSGS